LIFAVVAMGVMFLAVSLLFGYAQTSSRTVQSYRVDRSLRYAADGALEAAVVMVQGDPTLATNTSTKACRLKFDIGESASSTRIGFKAASFLWVACAATPNTASGNVDPADQGQLARDVTFTVRCGPRSITTVAPKGLLDCTSSSATSSTVAQARVRFEVDNSSGVPLNARAIVPKVLSWKLAR
jgi:hypothetical protein